MRTPMIMTLDLFDTEDGIKILEFQPGRVSGQKGYETLHGLDLREVIMRPWIAEQEAQGWKWPEGEKYFEVQETLVEDSFIDGNFFANIVCKNKAIQAALLDDMASMFPKQEIIAYDRHWPNVATKIKAAFPEHEELIIKAASQAAGKGIIPIKKDMLTDSFGDIISWTNDEMFMWYLSMYSPAFAVQERVMPKPVEIQGATYHAPIRLWMALEVIDGALKANFFNKGDLPAPIYYKLPAALGQGTYHTEIMSDIHDGPGVAEVDQQTQDRIYAQLAETVPLAFEKLMAMDFSDMALKMLNSGSEGQAMLALRQLVNGQHVMGEHYEEKSEAIAHIRPLFRQALQSSKPFTAYFNQMLVHNHAYSKLALDGATYGEKSVLFDGQIESWRQGNAHRAEGESKIPVRLVSDTAFRKIKPCSLLAP